MQNEMRDRLVGLLFKPFIQHKINELSDTGDIADHLIENGVIVPPCKVGDGIWVVEEDDITCYMFLAKSKGCVIATSWINDYDLDETIEYHIAETQNNLDTDLVVFPDEYCFATREEAEQKMKGGADNGKVY
jgi:hypothetical protein